MTHVVSPRGTPPRKGPRQGSSGRSRRPYLTAVALLVVTVGLLAYAVGSALTAPSAPWWTAVAAKVDRAVVDITANVGWQQADEVGTGIVLADDCQVLSGTGVVVASSGIVVTNNHAIEGATSIGVHDVGNGKSYRATVVATDRIDDLAVLQLHGARHLATIGVTAVTRVGEDVLAIGNATGVGAAPSVSLGRVTAVGGSLLVENDVYGTTENLVGVIETSALLQPGDSGGPLVDREGRLVGINTAAIYEPGCAPGSGRGVAIPAERALAVVRQAATGRGTSVVHVGPTACLGVEVLAATAVPANLPPGALVTGVRPRSPAGRTGLVVGDEIVALAGQPVGGPDALIDVLQRRRPGERVGVSWLDPSGTLHATAVALGSGPPQ